MSNGGELAGLVHNCDCLDYLDGLTAGSVDAIVTDPPYSLNIKSDLRGKVNPWADMCNASAWYAAWFDRARRALADDGCMWVFGNWRSSVPYLKAACDVGLPVTCAMVWDKGYIGVSGPKALRSSYEMVFLLAMPEFKIMDRSIADVQRFKWPVRKPTGHPAEKPVDLLKFLVSSSLTRRGLVVDCFAGSGSTGVAALELGHDFDGCELDGRWCDFANKRLASVGGGCPPCPTDRQTAKKRRGPFGVPGAFFAFGA